MRAVPRKQKRPRSVAAQPTVPPPATSVEDRATTSDSAVLRRHVLLLGALFVVALLAWSNSFDGAFIFDNKVLVQDTRIKAVTPQNIDLILNQEFWYPWSVTGLYRPLTTFSYLFNYAILGEGAHPAGYHWINFWIHVVNIALVYALGLLVFAEFTPALAMAALWALHPVLTESVTNIVGRSDLLAAFGVFAGLLCHARAASARGGWHKPLWLAALALAVTIGFFSKESAVVVLAVMLLYDFALASTSWGSRVPGYLAVALPMAIFLYVRGQVLAKLPTAHVAFADNPLVGADFLTSRLTAIKVIGKYIGRLLWPQSLSPDYSYNQIPLVTWRFQTWEDCKALVALTVCVCALIAAVVCYRRSRPAFFFVLFFFVTLAPTSNVFILIGTIMAERFLYLPSLAFAGLLVIVVYAICGRLPAAWPRVRFAAPAVLGAVTLALAARTYARNFDWHDEKSFWRSAAVVSSRSFKAHGAFAEALNDGTAKGLDLAIVEMDRALAIVNSLPDEKNVAITYLNAGSYYRQKGDLLAIKKSDGTYTATPESLPWYRKVAGDSAGGEEARARRQRGGTA